MNQTQYFGVEKKSYIYTRLIPTLILINCNDFKFIRDYLFRSRLNNIYIYLDIYIDISSLQTGLLLDSPRILNSGLVFLRVINQFSSLSYLFSSKYLTVIHIIFKILLIQRFQREYSCYNNFFLFFEWRGKLYFTFKNYWQIFGILHCYICKD